MTTMPLDTDEWLVLDKMDHKELREEVMRLRKAIRAHRDEKGHDRCWIDETLNSTRFFRKERLV